MPDIRLGLCSDDPLVFQFDRVEQRLRVLLVNADESGSMGGRTHENVRAYEKVAAVLGDRLDLVILHGFESDSCYEIVVTRSAHDTLGDLSALVKRAAALSEVADGKAVVREAGRLLEAHEARGTTNPKSHAAFLERFEKLLSARNVQIDLAVLNSSDGGFDGGPNSQMTRDIDRAMRRVASRCHCVLAANVLVGSAGSPEALTFFTGDPERFENRLLFSTEAAAPGVLLLSDFDPATLTLGQRETPAHTCAPGLPVWTVIEGDRLVTWQPEGSRPPPRVTVWRSVPKPGGRALLLRAEVTPQPRDVTLDHDGQEVFRLIARSLSDNPYLRESSREELNKLLAPLEALLGTRSAVLALIVSTPEAQAKVEGLRARVEANTASIRAVVDQEGLTPRERASRVNALNNARHLLKGELRQAREAMEQEALDKEFGFYEAHPNHWLVWLQPAIDTLRAQLGLTQVDPGAAMAHLSTRIRTAKSVEDGQARAADRYVDRLLAESRERRDRRARKADPRDHLPFESPAVWTDARCPVTGRPLTDGLAAIPFVADRSDLTSGNIMAGGQNVDRMPIDPGPIFSLSAVRELMWGELGQMASPYSTGSAWYNAAIPVLLGPATPAAMAELEKAIGWLATGTSAFAPQMAEAIPGGLAVLLGDPADGPNRNPQVQALLRTTALFNRYKSYRYVPGTAAFDETTIKQPLAWVWAKSLDEAGGAACLQSFGCITSYFARAVAADTADAAMVAEDLWAWACRNIARGALGAPGGDGRGGVQGVRQLAALLHHLVELDGYPLAAPNAVDSSVEEAPIVSGDVLDAAALAWVLGPLVSGWGTLAPVPRAAFVDALNGWMAGLAPDEQAAAIDALDEVFARLDAVRSEPDDAPAGDDGTGAPAGRSARPVVVTGRVHAGFDDIAALEALRPVRLTTHTPGITSARALLRRMTKAGETTWLPPADAATDLNPSALAFLEGHTALRPLRAWLRLLDAGLVGQPALAALRASADVRPIAPLPRVLPRLAALVGGVDAVVTTLRRAFAFVAKNAHGYADNQWATSNLRTADADTVDAILGPRPSPLAEPVPYTAADTLDWTLGPDWPRLDPRGYLPKGRVLDDRGETVGDPVRLPPEELVGPDELVCQRACTQVIARVAALDGQLIGGLHRTGRAVLGAYPQDLAALSADDRRLVIARELVPTVAGRVRGDPAWPRYFQDCALVLEQLCRLGVDTRTLRGEEPPELLAAEAAALRARPLPPAESARA